ncbi:MAG: PilW family protein [Chromatiales bacterium]|jgi:type IV pilus assembly protein PilW|nr:PilW family protein [Chromatiales bacterium]
MHRTTNTAARQRGLGLIEIMVALAISAILLTGVVQIFLGSKLSYRVTEANARIQEGGRFAVNFMNEDLRLAGYTGCFHNGLNNVENDLQNPDAFNWNLGIPLSGHDANGGGGWAPVLPAELAGRVLPGTDVVVARGLASDGIRVVEEVGPAAQIFVNQAGMNLKDGDIAMITDCRHGAIFQITNANPVGGNRVNFVRSRGNCGDAGLCNPGNADTSFDNNYGTDAEIARLRVSAYFIANNNAGEPALFRMQLANNGGMNAEELVAGVENLQVLYGEDTNDDGIANRYVTARDVGNLANVVSIRYSLLLRSENNIASEPQTYDYNGEPHTAADDLRMRRVFSSTVKIRNRGIL